MMIISDAEAGEQAERHDEATMNMAGSTFVARIAATVAGWWFD